MHRVAAQQGGALDDGAGQKDWVHIGDGCDGSSASYLVGDLIEACACSLGLELVGYCPSGALGCVAEMFLLSDRVDFEDYAVGGYGEVFALCVPVVDEGEDIIDGLALLHAL